MRTIPPGFLDAPVTDLAVCWKIVRRDSQVIYGTESDVDVVIGDSSSSLFGTYLAHAGITGSDIHSSADLSVDNLEVTGALQDAEPTDTSVDTSALFITDLSAADIEAGMFDNAEATTFLVNVTDPDLYQHVLRSGWLGSVTRTAEGQYKTELRGLTQALSQTIVRTYGVNCDAELFDSRCRAAPRFLSSGSVTVAFTRRDFQVGIGDITTIINAPGGKITWTSGLNTGYSMEVKSFLSLHVTLFRPMPKDVLAGDTFDFSPGCNKHFTTCQNSYDNLVNFRGHGFFVPGDTEILKRGPR